MSLNHVACKKVLHAHGVMLKHYETKVCFLQEEPTGWWTVCLCMAGGWNMRRQLKEALERRGQRLVDNLSSASWPMIKDGWVLSLNYLKDVFNWCKPVPSLALTRSVGWRPITRQKPAHLKDTHEDGQWVQSITAGLRWTHSKASAHTDSNVTSQTSNTCYTQCH